VHAYFDLVDGRERVVLAYGVRDVEPLVRVQRESLLERFPLATGGVHKSLWHESVRRIVEHGAGYAAFVPVAGFDAQLREREVADDGSAALLAHHLQGRRVRVLSDDVLERAGDTPASTDGTLQALRRLGVVADAAVPLRHASAAALR
jgi:hypothetical protein